MLTSPTPAGRLFAVATAAMLAAAPGCGAKDRTLAPPADSGPGGASGAAASGGNGGSSGAGGTSTGGNGAGAAGGFGGSTGSGGTSGSGGADAALGGSGGASGSGGSGGSGGVTCHVVVINEISTDGALGGSDEFVELYNAGTCVASLDGWTLDYSSPSGSTPSTRWIGMPGDSLASGGFFVIAGTGFTRTKQGVLTSGFAVSGGGVGLHDASKTLLDAVAYETLTTSTHPFAESTPVANIPSDKSAARIPDGSDTNVNADDFKVPCTRTPGAANAL